MIFQELVLQDQSLFNRSLFHCKLQGTRPNSTQKGVLKLSKIKLNRKYKQTKRPKMSLLAQSKSRNDSYIPQMNF